MRLEIGGTVVSYRNVFVAEMQFMHGDADMFTQYEFVFDTLVGACEYVQFKDAWESLSHQERFKLRDRKNDDRLMSLDGFATVFGGYIENWPLDETTIDLGLTRLANFWRGNLYYYDSEGVKHTVEIIRDQEE
jgi:hypothetical protein